MLRTIILFFLAAVSLCAQVAVTDTLKVAAGNQNFDGFVTITSPQMTYGGVTYLAGTKTVSVVNGAFTVNLWPNYGATPANTYYRVTYTPRRVGGEPIAPWTEMWEVIPANCTTTVLCTVAQVRKAGAVTNPAGSPLTNPMTTAGDMLYYGTALARLPIGTTGQFLTVVNGIPAWTTNSIEAHADTHALGSTDPVTLNQSQITGLTSALDGKAATSHEHNASTDLTSGALPPERGGLGADASGYTGFVRMTGGVASAGPIATADLPAVIDFSGKTSTIPAKTGTLAPATCTVGETFFDTDATAGENWLLCTSVNTWTPVVGGGGGSLTTYEVTSFTASFTSQTSVSLTHNFGSTKQIIACYNGSNVFLEPSSITIGGPSSTVTFAAAQTGSCTVIGGTGLYEESFTSQTSVNLDHDYNTTAIMVRCYDADEVEVLPSSVTATDADNATVTFANAQTGRCVVTSTLASGGGGGGSGTVTSVQVEGISGILSATGGPVTTSGTIALSLDTQTAYKFLSTGASTAVPSFQTIPAAALPVMVGDSGSGGIQGVVPAPAAGDAAAGKFLKADGTYAVPAGGGGTGDVTMLQATATLSSWGAITAAGTSGSCVRKNVTLTGAVGGDAVIVGPPADIEVGLTWQGFATTDLVVVQLCNNTGASITPADGRTFRVQVNRSTL